MQELDEQNEKLAEEIKQYKQVKQFSFDAGNVLTVKSSFNITLYLQKLLLAQNTDSGCVLERDSLTPYTYEYIPPRVSQPFY